MPGHKSESLEFRGIGIVPGILHHSLLRNANSVACWDMCAIREDEGSHDFSIQGDCSQTGNSYQQVDGDMAMYAILPA